ncbi:MAG: cytoplasmic protein [Burkholderiales bacterium]|nr:cytoplasmic protein [Burkholderiales bacterium]
MHAQYRIDILKDGALWGALHIDHPQSEAALHEMLAVLRGQGYTCRVMQASGERRLLESTPAGVSLLFREPIFQARAD